MLDGISAQAFHRAARWLGIQSGNLVPLDGGTARQAEQVEHPVRPAQGIIGQIAFPQPDAVRRQELGMARGSNQRLARPVEQAPEVETLMLLEQGPAMGQG